MNTNPNSVLISRCKGISEAVEAAKAGAAKYGYAGAAIDECGYIIVSAPNCHAARPALIDQVVLFDFARNFVMNTLTSEDSHRLFSPSNDRELPAGAKPLSDLYANWDRFADVPVSEDGAIEAPFLHFGVGADRETIWSWFESQNPRFIVGDVMNGIRDEDDRNLSQNAGNHDKQYRITVDGVEFMTGDAASIGVVFRNLEGHNFEPRPGHDELHGEWLQWAAAEFKTPLEPFAPIEMLSPDGTVLQASKIKLSLSRNLCLSDEMDFGLHGLRTPRMKG